MRKVPFTPEWCANASRVGHQPQHDRRTAAPPELGTYNFRYMLISSMAYVTGSHAVKAGLQWHIGQNWLNRERQRRSHRTRIRDGVPDSVIVYDTPGRPTT